MSKGLEALKEIKDFAKNEWEDERFDFDIIEKELKALEIIKNNLNIDEILLAVKGVCKASDYDLLKEVLNA